MNPNTGRLMSMAAGIGLAAGYEQVPAELDVLARNKMLRAAIARTEPQVNMNSQHPLAKWGRAKRKEKRKAKIAAASRRRNRK